MASETNPHVANLTERQAAFVREYAIDANGTQAAIRAGYSPKAAKQQGSTLLTYPNVQAAIDWEKRRALSAARVTVEGILESTLEIRARCMQAQPVTDKDGVVSGEFKFDATNALKANELLGRHLRMFTDKTEIGVDQSVASLITQLQGSTLRLRK